MSGRGAAAALAARVALRSGWALVVLAGTLVVTVALTQALPGDPARLLAGPRAKAAEVERLRGSYALGGPFSLQVLRAAKRLAHRAPGDGTSPKEHRSCAAVGPLHVDLGWSFVHGKPVLELVRKRAWASLELALAASIVQILLGVGLGALGAARAGRRLDALGTALALVLFATPTFVLGMGAQLLFSHRLGLFPIDGDGGGSGPEHWRSLVLPAVTLGLFATAFALRVARAEVGRALVSDWARTIRAKGAGERRVLAHAVRAALPATLTVVVLDLGTLAGGAMVTESVFRWPGLGRLVVDAIQNRDGPLLVGTTLVSAAIVVASTLLLDASLWAVDPRRRLA